MQWINNFLVSKKNEAKTQIKRSKIKLLYLLAPCLFLLNRGKCSAYEDKFPTCLYRYNHRLRTDDRCVTSVKSCPTVAIFLSSVVRVIIRHLVKRFAFKNAFNTFSTTLIAFNNFKHSTLIV